MLLESLLAYAHISAILLLAVFLTAKTALMRVDVIAGRKSVLDRLMTLDLWLWASFAAVLATGVARMAWGVKGWAWYAGNPLLWGKVVLFAVMVAMALPQTRTLRRWNLRRVQDDFFPDAEDIRAQRVWLMWQAHVMVVVPLLGALLDYGY